MSTRKCICKQCGQIFDAPRDHTICPDCARANKVIVKPRVCKQCGQVFEGGPRAWYCPSCRLERKREVDRNIKRKGSQRKLGTVDFCAACGEEYTVTSGRQRYCPNCTAKTVSETVAKDKLEKYYENRGEINPLRNARRAGRRGLRVCAVCGAEYMTTGSYTRMTCGSEQCRIEYQSRNMQKRPDGE